MQMTGNTILITGGGSGIGLGLAEAFHKLGNTVLISGRRQQALDAAVAANPGMIGIPLDIDSPQSIAAFARKVTSEYPALNVLIHNAGIMRTEKFADGGVETAEATITTNLLGPIRLNDALLAHLRTQPHATVMTVTSGLAFVPLNLNSTYCATKAAIHSWTQSLRYQLKDTAVEVLELIPPYVQTELTGAHQANDPTAMPLADFIAETMSLLAAGDQVEIAVSRVQDRLKAAVPAEYEAFFTRFNDMMTAARANR